MPRVNVIMMMFINHFTMPSLEISHTNTDHDPRTQAPKKKKTKKELKAEKEAMGESVPPCVALAFSDPNPVV